MAQYENSKMSNMNKKTKRKININDELLLKKLKKINEENDEVEIAANPQYKISEPEHPWTDYELLGEFENLNYVIAENIVKLFEEGNTIPFIARYRRNFTGDIAIEKLRDVKETYDKILTLKTKAQTVLKSLEKSGKLNDTLQRSVLAAKTAEELEHVYAPYKPGGKKTLVEKAKILGLEEPALKLLENTEPVSLSKYINEEIKDLSTVEDVEKGVMHIIAHIMATDTEILDKLRKMRLESYFLIETKKSIAKKSSSKDLKNTKLEAQQDDDEKKYELYYDFQTSSNSIKPHQVLAINRGESQKALSVKVIVPDFVHKKFFSLCVDRFLKRGCFNDSRKRIIEASIDDAYTRLIHPLIVREVRSELKSKAEKASLEVFSSNLKQILLAKPIKGRPILGIDPGYKYGCKIALISSTGNVLKTDVLFPFRDKSEKSAEILKKLLKAYNCTLIALGNGTACRETETWLSELINKNVFSPLEVFYTIVDENGASIYSCSPEARKEFPNLDPNLISAVSLARRVQEPLAELVKVEPKHLGVGMYQHDLSKKQLEEALDEVVTECVSFVGVDLNTASQCLLRKIAGLHAKRATAIVIHREKNGPFFNRSQLKEVPGIGPKTFEQCAGFLRVGPTDPNNADDFYNNSRTTKLDCTYIHPESYNLCNKLLDMLHLRVSDVGKEHFIEAMQRKRNTLNVSEISEELKSSKESIELIIDCLCKPLNFDLRSEMDKTPLFRKSLTNILDLKSGSVLTGRITNVTHFGCFVDIGVGTKGLIHSSKQKGIQLQIGDKVEVKVVKIEIDRKRIGLELNKKI
ncbi:S1 RNA-binding domain-containing protein 1 isoform X2 [Agrilus planipennis]|uniref:S1 RNA-binding domain-containing protein 1 isoform X2 n=1 Tax=Agrilus planipennis TaxID=224129 RepID=A0A1W4X2L0_AGRPL|nr:S1 RNA-binding domain-containing protein 1 isoform X2 [Agrilus planipennis]